MTALVVSMKKKSVLPTTLCESNFTQCIVQARIKIKIEEYGFNFATELDIPESQGMKHSLFFK